MIGSMRWIVVPFRLDTELFVSKFSVSIFCRFDRELVFPLPNLTARATILDIHTRKWAEPPSAELREELAQTCVGYCGADLKVGFTCGA
jgi:AAA+ superfamily predicted ATPase